MPWFTIMIWSFISGVCFLSMGLMMKTAAIDINEEMQLDQESAKQEQSFYERMQRWKYGNDVIKKCLSMEETESESD